MPDALGACTVQDLTYYERLYLRTVAGAFGTLSTRSDCSDGITRFGMNIPPALLPR